MLRQRGGDAVAGGNYWNFTTGERITVKTGDVLPGGRETTYYRTHPLLILLAAPAVGLVYAVFLPFIGIAAILKMVTEKALGGAARSVADLANFSWRPLEAYFGGKGEKRGKKASDEKRSDEKSGTKQ